MKDRSASINNIDESCSNDQHAHTKGDTETQDVACI